MRVGIGLGANLGDRRALVEGALEKLAALGNVRASRIYSSAAEDCPEGSPAFLNVVAVLEGYRGGLFELLDRMQGWEREAGRVAEDQRARNAPRPLDMDILACGDLVLTTPRLELPHPRVGERLFVLRPWAELEPERVVAGTGKTVQALLAGLESRTAKEKNASCHPIE